MPTRIITTGDCAKIPVQLKKDGEVFTIPPSATVRAAIISSAALLVGPIAVLEGEPGSDWANSLVVTDFSESDTAGLTATPNGAAYSIEVEVDDGQCVTTWQAGVVKVRAGRIA